MNEELCYRRQVSRQHLEILTEYMERYPPLALASARSREGHIQSKRMWEKIARTLNKIDETVTKSGKSWARYWIDLKFKIRRKYAVIQKCQVEGTHCTVQLSPLEERLVKVLTDEDGNLLPTASVYHQMRYSHHFHHQNAKYSGATNTRISNNVKAIKNQDQDDKIDDSGGDMPDSPEDYVTLNSLMDLQSDTQDDTKPNISNIGKSDCLVPDPIQIVIPGERSLEDLKRDLLEFELKKQKELFEMEKRQRREKHDLELAILRLKKQLLMKELKKS